MRRRQSNLKRQPRAIRKLVVEPLERRLLLTSGWHNPWIDADVNADGLVAPIDVLFVVNRINTGEPLGDPPSGPHPFYDTSGNGTLEPQDVVTVVNVINYDVSPPLLTLGLDRDTGPNGTLDSDLLTADATISGRVEDKSGTRLITGRMDNGSEFLIGVTPTGTFLFDPGLAADGSDDGEHELEVTAVDGRGKSTTERLTFVLAADPTGVSRVTPEDGETLVNVVRESRVYFDEPVDPATVTVDSLFPIANGQRVPGRVVVSSTEKFATYYYDTALPSSTEIRLVVAGDLILGRDGFPVDADSDGHPGGSLTSDFRTLPLTRIPGTNVFGYVRDSYTQAPIAGATIRVDAYPEANAVTDETGRFELLDMPAPDFFVHVDGSTASSAPAGFAYPNVGKPFHSVPGRTIQLNMAGEPFDVYLPPMAIDDIQDLSAVEATGIGFGPAGKLQLQQVFPQLDASVWDRLQVEFAPASAVNDHGEPVSQAVVIPVPPDRIPAPLPPHLNPQLVVSIQAPGATTFDVPAPITFPNLDGLAPGRRASLYSFNHDAGRFELIGTGTVSDDGQRIVSDPGVGVPAPGWHFVDPSSCGVGGPPLGTSSSNSSNGNSSGGNGGEGESDDAEVIFLTAGTSGTLFDLTWESDPGDAESCNSFDETPADPEGTTINVKIAIDGPLSQFLNQTGTETVAPGINEFTLAVGTSESRSFKAQAKSYAQMFPGGLQDVSKDRLYGGKVTVTEQRVEPDGSSQTSVKTYLVYRWVNVSAADVSGNMARLRSAPGVGVAEFERTIEDAERIKEIDYFIANNLPTTLTETANTGGFDLNQAALSGTGSFEWTYENEGDTSNSATVQITAGEDAIGEVLVEATGAQLTTVSVNRQGFEDEFLRVAGWLVNAWVPGPDGCPGTCGVDTDGDGLADLDSDGDTFLDGDDDKDGSLDNLQEYAAAGSDDLQLILYDRSMSDTNGDGIPDVSALSDVLQQVTLDATGVRAEVVDPFNQQVDPDGMPGTGDEYQAFVVPSLKFKTEVLAGLLPTDKTEPGPDGVMGTRDDGFSVAKQTQLESLAADIAQQVVEAVELDFEFDSSFEQQTAVEVVPDNTGDVTMTWKDTEDNYGAADFDANVDHLRVILSSNAIPLAAKKVELTKHLNPSIGNSGEFAVSLNMIWNSAGASFAEFVANTVSHEIGHTFGLNDAYVDVAGWPPAGTPPFGTASCNPDENCAPHDLMRLGISTDGDLTFDARNKVLLLASLGAHVNDHPKWADAVQLYRDAFNLPDIGATPQDGIREARLEGPFTPVVAVTHGNDVYFGFEGEPADSLGAIVADGGGGELVSVEYQIENRGAAVLNISSISLAAGDAGFLVSGSPGQASLQPGEAMVLTIQFDPATVGSASDTLLISSNSTIAEAAVNLVAEGLALDPIAELIRERNNNLGAILVNGGEAADDGLFRLHNRGGATLTINGIVAEDGADAFQVLGAVGTPIGIAPGQSLQFGLAYDPTAVGLQRGLFYLETNDPVNPRIRFSAVGTGLPDSGRIEPVVGHDYVRVRVAVDGPDTVIRQRSNRSGRFEVSVPPEGDYLTLIFEPTSNLIARDFGETSETGDLTRLTLGTRFHPSTSADSDFDGLPDDVELAIGTGPLLFDSDQDLIDDYSEMQLGLNPLSLGNYPTGVIAALPLLGPAQDIEIVDNRAYVATSEHGMAIVDVSAANSPIVLGQLDLTGHNTRIAVDPVLDIAAVAHGNGIHLVDVSDPMLPTPVGRIETSVSSITIYDSLIFVGNSGRVDAYDVRTQELIQSLPMPQGGNVTELVREGAILYAGQSGSNRLVTIDVSQFGLAEVLGSGAVPSASGRMAVGNGLALLAANKVRTADVSDPANPIPLGEGPDNVGAQSVALNGSNLALIGTPTLLQVHDVSDPEQPAFQFSVPLGQLAADVAVASGIAYAGTPGGLQVINYLGIDVAGQAPQASLFTPLPDADPVADGFQVVEGRTLPVQAVVVDDVQVRDVELLVDDEVVARDSSFPFDFSVVALSDTSDTLRIQLRARDTGGNVGLSEVLSVELIEDTEEPRIIAISPADDVQIPQEQGVDALSLRFTEPMAETVVEAVSLRTVAGVPLVPNDVQLRGDARFLRLTFDRFAPGEYEVVLNPAATDRAGNAIANTGVVSSFTIVPDTTAPGLTRIHPGEGERFVLAELLEAVTLDFSEPMDRNSLSAANLRLLNGQDQIVPITAVDFADADTRAVVHFGQLPADDYRFVIQADQVTDAAGNALGSGGITTSFRIFTELTPPTVVAVFPGDQTAIPQGLTSATVLFSEPMNVAGFTAANLTLRQADGTPVAIRQVDADNDGQLAVLRFDPLPKGRYEFEIDETGLSDLAGNQLEEAEVTQFLLGQPQSARDFYHDQRYDLQDWNLTLADLNLDGNLDLVSGQHSTIQVRLGNGTGSFGGPLIYTFTEGMAIRAARALLINDDNIPDLAVGSGSVGDGFDFFATLFGVGDGTFVLGEVIPSTVYVNQLELADINQDGRTDVLAVSNFCRNFPCNNYDRQLEFYLQNDDATFARTTVFTGYRTPDFAVGDLDGDGDDDVVTAPGNSGQFRTDANLVVIENGVDDEGNLRLSIAHRYASSSEYRDLVLADFNNDGLLDIVGGDHQLAYFWPGTATLEFGEAVELANVDGTQGLAARDFDGDGNQDLGYHFGSDFVVALGAGDGTFGSSPRFPVSPETGTELLGDLNNDQILDLVGEREPSSVFLGLEPFDYELPGTDYPTGFDRPSALVEGDFDGDGDLDLAVVNEGFLRYDRAYVSILLANEQGHLIPAERVELGEVSPSGIVTGDFDSDGDLDLAISESGRSGYYGNINDQSLAIIVRGQGDGSFGTPESYEIGQGAEGLVAGDLDGDGDLDLVTANAGRLYSGTSQGSLSILISNGDGSFQTATSLADAQQPWAIVMGDFNGDLLPDVLTAGSSRRDDQGLTLYTNNGQGGFLAGVQIPLDEQPDDLAMGDFNEDGNLDAVSLGDDAAYMLLGGGDGTFTVGEFTVNWDSGLSVGDVDGDDHLDLAFISQNGTMALVLFGLGDGTFGDSRGYAAGNRSVTLADINGDRRDDLIGLWNDGRVALRLHTGFPNGSPLRAAAPAGATGVSSGGNLGLAESLSPPQLQETAALAIQQWTALGVDASRFAAVEFRIADLPGGYLGLALGDRVTIDRDAAGFGWIAGRQMLRGGDPLQPSAVSPMDLLTVISHELGHVLGLPDLHSLEFQDHLMFGRLSPGVRRGPSHAELDEIMASDKQLDLLLRVDGP